ncbi:response regulator [Pseudoxanthomonas sp. SGD-10]|nr:response regulator [Pseudoxanthomonas sp. SGD-10]
MLLSFVIIDDRELDCYIAEKIIEKTGRCSDCKSFYDARSALAYINSHTPVNPTVILLDIMMPVMTGFGFIEVFETLPESVRNQYHIVPITTSLNQNEIDLMNSYSSVVEVLRKPYSFAELNTVLNTIIQKISNG